MDVTVDSSRIMISFNVSGADRLLQNSRRLGFAEQDLVELGGERYRIQFLMYRVPGPVRPMATDFGVLSTYSQPDHPSAWKSQECVIFAFDCHRDLGRLPSGKDGIHRSFTVSHQSFFYKGQFLIYECPQRGESKIDWEGTSRARAGIPTLGKRR